MYEIYECMKYYEYEYMNMIRLYSQVHDDLNGMIVLNIDLLIQIPKWTGRN